jgi:hypothetical protein
MGGRRLQPLHFARQAWAAASTHGYGYEPQPLGTRFSADTVNGYYLDLTGKTEAAVPSTALPPADLAQLALGWWERHAAGELHAAERFVALAELLEATAERASDGLRWSYSMPVAKYGLTGPWYSAMAQGQVASVFVRAVALTADERYQRLGTEAIAPLLARSDTDLVTHTPDGPILEEAPSRPPSHILNGWIYALWGLFDVAVGLGDAAARERFEASAQCLATRLDRYDAGWWTRYSLFPHQLPDLAKPFYHRLHAAQAEAMWRLTGAEPFARAAARWRRYDRLPNRTRAILQKALFVAVERRFLR